MLAWIFRLVKGFIIGTGFIIPGVSGGVFAAIFGVYERMIKFFANIKKDFVKNFIFFFPIGIGVILSMILCSKVLGEFFAIAAVPLIWFFIGCVLGTLPALNKQATAKGRELKHVIIFFVTLAAMVAFLIFIQGILSNIKVPTNNVFIWLLAGALMGLGAIVPGLSPSNFLVFLGIYSVMMDKIGNLDIWVIIPVILGAFLCFLLLSKAFDKLFEKAYAGMYHFILGIIIASTVMIIPFNGKVIDAEEGIVAAYDTTTIIISIAACLGGIAVGFVMGLLEKKYKDKD